MHCMSTTEDGTICTFDFDAPDFLDGVLVQTLHDDRMLGFRAGADYVRHVRPDGARVITAKDGTRWTFRDTASEATRAMQLELQECEQRLAFLQHHYRTTGNTLAPLFRANGYDENYCSPECNLGPIWAECEHLEIEPRIAYLRAMLALEGHAGTQADDTARARRRALATARKRKQRAKQAAKAAE